MSGYRLVDSTEVARGGFLTFCEETFESPAGDRFVRWIVEHPGPGAGRALPGGPSARGTVMSASPLRVVPEPITRPLVVGVPKETKENEYRVSVTPDGVQELGHHGSTVVVETGAGVGAAITDDEY